MRKNQPVVTPADLVTKLRPFMGLTFKEVSKTTGITFPESLAGKGCVGHFVEDLVGLPRDNDRLDFNWGDLKTKTHHAGAKKLGGCVIGSLNSLASEMIESDTNFDDFILGKKIGQTVLVVVSSNRKGGGAAGEGWEKFTFETVSDHNLKELPVWEGVCEDWSFLKNYVWQSFLTGTPVSSGKKGPNDYLCFNSCGGQFSWRGRNLRRSGGIQLALGATLVQKVCG
jgi:hypothetical protein